MSKQFVITWTGIGLIAAMGVVLAGCVGGDPETIPPVTLEDTSTTRTTVETVSGATSGGAGEEDPEATLGLEPDLFALEELWAELWSATGLLPDERPAAIAALGDSLDPTVAELAPNLLPESTLREVYTFPAFSPAIDGGTVEIKDCIIHDPEIFESITHVHSGTAILDEDGQWVIESIVRESRGCIPAELNAEILADYKEYWDASTEYWNPPDSGHQGLEQTLTGSQLELVRERVEQLDNDDLVLVQDYKDFRPEITTVYSRESVLIRDCIALDPEGGVFDGSGKRAPGARVATEGDRDLFEIRMTLEGGQWKAETIEIAVDEDCHAAPTPIGLPIV